MTILLYEVGLKFLRYGTHANSACGAGCVVTTF